MLLLCSVDKWITCYTTHLSIKEVKLNFVSHCTGNRIQAACVPTGPASTSAASSYSSLGDGFITLTREHRQFGVQIFIHELLTFPGNGIPKLILFWCLFQDTFCKF